MRCPGCQEFRQRHDSEGRMPSAPLEIFRLQIQRTQLVQVFRPQTGKFIQQLSQRLALALSYVSLPIEGVKRPALAKLQNDLRAWDPIRAFAVNQMAYDIEGAPGIFAFILERPGFRK